MDEREIAAWNAVARWYHGFFTGIVLSTVVRRSPADAAELLFRVFRHQHEQRFLPGLQKLGIAHLPDAVACAQYHYLSNRIGGVKVEYMRESDRKAWVRFPPPRWMWNGIAICAIPSEVSAAMLRGWYAQNPVSLGNARLGFICTKMTVDGQPGLEGYFLEHDHDLRPEQRLRFAPDEEAPDFDPALAPELSVAAWPEARLRRAHRGYAMEYIRTTLQAAVGLFGTADAAELLSFTARLVSMQTYEATAAALGRFAPDVAGFAAFLVALARAQGDTAEIAADGTVRQTGWRLMAGVAEPDPAIFTAWNALLEGALAAHNRRLRLTVERRSDRGIPVFEWRIA